MTNCSPEYLAASLLVLQCQDAQINYLYNIHSLYFCQEPYAAKTEVGALIPNISPHHHHHQSHLHNNCACWSFSKNVCIIYVIRNVSVRILILFCNAIFFKTKKTKPVSILFCVQDRPPTTLFFPMFHPVLKVRPIHETG